MENFSLVKRLVSKGHSWVYDGPPYIEDSWECVYLRISFSRGQTPIVPKFKEGGRGAKASPAPLKLAGDQAMITLSILLAETA